MKQIAQHIKTGAMKVADVPAPAIGRGMVLVKNYFSVISAGTEKTSVDSRKSSLLQRAKSQPDEVRKVIEEVRRNGLTRTYRRIMGKLDSHAGLGYSTAGVVIGVEEGVQDIEIGDRVACAGAEYASHSDIIAVPRNLVARIPHGVSMESAAYSTIAAIALQGVRQTAPMLGETVVVIGLGLLGQFTVQFLKANGCRVIGVDLDPLAVAMATRSGADAALHRVSDPVESVVQSFSGGHGADAVIITAGTSSNDPIELAGRLTRERGRVVIVGAAAMNIPRGPYYMKEIEIRISRSYGPGRYDRDYEEEGLDFPIGYVRWTENRNMQAYLQLLLQGRINTEVLTTHRFGIDDALRAYALIEGEKSEPYVGIVLSYEDPSEKELLEMTRDTDLPEVPVISPKRSSLTVGVIGAGSFASGFLLPHLKAMDDVTLDSVCNRSGLTSTDMRNKFGFRHSTTKPEEVLQDETIGTVFIATRHAQHAPFTYEALRRGKHVFVEKPLALNEQELAPIEALLTTHPELRGKVHLMVGFNRRFAPLVRDMRSFFSSFTEPAVVHYYVNAGFLPKDHWTQHPIDGGGRIIGEVCHFIDTIQFLTGALPRRISAECIASENALVTPQDNVNITMRMRDGSIGIITYVANGDASIPKERIIMSRGNATAVMDNFQSLTLARDGKQTKKKGTGDKGHQHEVMAFMDAIRRKSDPVISLESLIITTRTTYAIIDALTTKQVITLDDRGFRE
ncbi:MAG: bi-domain-containing oxidoreductase [Bacteroidota bacterium]|jgi:polar amino acid transport system substrate-binding protein|nr:bi-domain-containing oxidoreductase [Bacteroidota bacterium]